MFSSMIHFELNFFVWCVVWVRLYSFGYEYLVVSTPYFAECITVT